MWECTTIEHDVQMTVEQVLTPTGLEYEQPTGNDGTE
jgi:hypothetical protein